jgi:hypothetical protein
MTMAAEKFEVQVGALTPGEDSGVFPRTSLRPLGGSLRPPTARELTFARLSREQRARRRRVASVVVLGFVGASSLLGVVALSSLIGKVLVGIVGGALIAAIVAAQSGRLGPVRP